MGICKKFGTTAGIIACALYPQTRRDPATRTPPGGTNAGSYEIPAGGACRALADLSLLSDRQGNLSILFRDCSWPAAPFLLYRLKREGFSACRVLSVPSGLLVKGVR